MTGDEHAWLEVARRVATALENLAVEFARMNDAAATAQGSADDLVRSLVADGVHDVAHLVDDAAERRRMVLTMIQRVPHEFTPREDSDGRHCLLCGGDPSYRLHDTGAAAQYDEPHEADLGCATVDSPMGAGEEAQ